MAIEVIGEPLTESDIAKLQASFISPELARQAGIFRVDSATGAWLMGRYDGDDYSGIVFPYFLPDEPLPREYRLRRDHPDLEQKSDGTIKEQKKYLSPPGRSNMLYFAPGIRSEWLSDTSLPIIITEGEKKTLALFALAYWMISQSAKPRFLPIGVAGVWNWRSGNVGKTEDTSGNRTNVKGVIPDLDRLIWKGRIVYIIYDANVVTNEGVRAARREFAKELQQRGAIVRYVNLPNDFGFNGVDDILGAKGAEFVLDLIDKSTDAIDAKAKRPSQASELLGIAESLQLFGSEGEGFASIAVNGHRENLPLKSRAFRRWLSQQFYDRTGSAPNSQALQDAIEALQGKALFASEERLTFRRIAQYSENLYLDLCNDQWQAVEISADGWRIVQCPPVVFLRSNGMRALPLPEKNGSLAGLRQFINIGSDENFELVKGWLVQALRFNTPFPVLLLHGEQGSAKSTTARVLRALIDPNVAPLRSEPREERDLIAAIRNSWIIGLDNLSRIPIWLSDTLCRVSTGGGFGARELYTDGDEVLIDAMRPVIITGIEDIATRGDLLDRALILYLPNIREEQRREEREFWIEFEKVRPRLLGAICDAASKALRNIEHTKLSRKPRMADFASWAVAAEGVSEEESQFLKAYQTMRVTGNELALEASPIALLVRQFIEQEGKWFGKASALLKELAQLADEQTRKQKSFPASPRALSGRLRSLAPNLRAVGIDIQFNLEISRTDKRGIQIERIGNFASSSSAPSAIITKATSFNGSSADTNADANLDADGRQTQNFELQSAKEVITGKGLDSFGQNADGADANISANSSKEKRVKMRI